MMMIMVVINGIRSMPTSLPPRIMRMMSVIDIVIGVDTTIIGEEEFVHSSPLLDSTQGHMY